MIAYALIETVVVACVVSACVFALALRLLPTAWLKAPLGAWLDRDGRPLVVRNVGARWRGDLRSGCANGCCASGDGCAIGRASAPCSAHASTRIPIMLLDQPARDHLP